MAFINTRLSGTKERRSSQGAVPRDPLVCTDAACGMPATAEREGPVEADAGDGGLLAELDRLPPGGRGCAVVRPSGAALRRAPRGADVAAEGAVVELGGVAAAGAGVCDEESTAVRRLCP